MVGRKYENEGIARHGAKYGDSGLPMLPKVPKSLLWLSVAHSVQVTTVCVVVRTVHVSCGLEMRVSKFDGYGEQAASVLATVKRSQYHAKGEHWSSRMKKLSKHQCV